MQNKGLVKLFALLFGLVSVFQLSFTLKSNQIENKANEFAITKISGEEIDFDKKRNQEKINYLDSLSNISVFNIGIAEYTYDEVKDRESRRPPSTATGRPPRRWTRPPSAT